MRYARIPAKPQRPWSQILADASAVATLFIGGAIFYQLACPLEAYAAAGEHCLSPRAQTAMTLVQVGAGAFVGMMVMAFLFIARDTASAGSQGQTTGFAPPPPRPGSGARGDTTPTKF